MQSLFLPHLTPNQAVDEALNQILDERKGEQHGLLCDFTALNIAMGKYFRFNNVNLFAGLSGHGKSYLMTILTNSFLDYKEGGLNENIDFIPVILHFCFEMSAYNEILRSVASDIGVSYSYLLSGQYDKASASYNNISDEELVRIKVALDYYRNRSILYFEVPGNVKVLENTIDNTISRYNKIKRQDGKKYKFIINIDHTLLVDTLDEKSALDLMGNIGKMAIRIRKRHLSMVNLLGQLNNNIEDVKRITTKALHYPIKSDIYAQGQLYNACDSVFVIHQPELLKITSYGIQNLSTAKLIHLLKLKARHGKVGSIWLENNLNNGRIEEKQKKEVENDENLEHI